MAEQKRKNTQGISPSGSTTGAAASPEGTMPTEPSPIEQRFDPMSGKELSGVANGEDKGLMQQFRSSASEAYESATTKATEKLEEKKTDLSAGLNNVASSIRQLGDNLGGSTTGDQLSRLTSEFSSSAAEKIQRAANYFERQDLNAVYRDVESLARRNPALVLGGAFALGFLAARFLKSSPPRRSAAAGRNFDDLSQQQRPQMGGQAARGL
jgi:hypothetical protein